LFFNKLFSELIFGLKFFNFVIFGKAFGNINLCSLPFVSFFFIRSFFNWSLYVNNEGSWFSVTFDRFFTPGGFYEITFALNHVLVF
jgi:hypothetical protein